MTRLLLMPRLPTPRVPFPIFNVGEPVPIFRDAYQAFGLAEVALFAGLVSYPRGPISEIPCFGHCRSSSERSLGVIWSQLWVFASRAQGVLNWNRRDRKWLVWGSAPGGPRMAANKDGRIVETPTEARQAKPGASILLVLNVSIALAAIVLSVVWFIFFRT